MEPIAEKDAPDFTWAEHRIVYEAGFEAVCSCGAHLSIYGLTRSIASVFAEHVRNSRVTSPDGGER